MVAMCGVRKRGWTVPKTCGSSPSRDMAMKIRAWLRKSTRSTLVMPARPPTAMMPAQILGRKLPWAVACWAKAAAMGASVLISG